MDTITRITHPDEPAYYEKLQDEIEDKITNKALEILEVACGFHGSEVWACIKDAVVQNVIDIMDETESDEFDINELANEIGLEIVIQFLSK